MISENVSFLIPLWGCEILNDVILSTHTARENGENAHAHFVSKGRNSQFILVGQGTQRSLLKVARSRVAFTTFISKSSKNGFREISTTLVALFLTTWIQNNYLFLLKCFILF